jgi:hypothetical protein
MLVYDRLSFISALWSYRRVSLVFIRRARWDGNGNVSQSRPTDRLARSAMLSVLPIRR